MIDRDLERLASEWWLTQRREYVGDDDDAFDQVFEMILNDSTELSRLLQALVRTAPEGAISYVGVAILEDLTDQADFAGRPDRAIDALLAAELNAAEMFEVLSGPYPNYLARWRVQDRLADVFTSNHLAALFDWHARLNRRIVLDGAGVRLEPHSEWFE